MARFNGHLTLADTINGTASADQIYGWGGNDYLYGGAGDDLLDGGDGDDNLFGGAGNDKSYGGIGDDTFRDVQGNNYFDGGAGFDVADYRDASTGILADLAQGSVSRGVDKDLLKSIEGVIGSNFSDKLFGDALANSLSGGKGNDLLYGGGGYDSLTGGLGADTFAYKSAADAAAPTTVSTTDPSGYTWSVTSFEKINDFNFAEGDILDLRSIDANSTTSQANEAFQFVQSFSGRAGELTIMQAPSAGFVGANPSPSFWIRGDTNGDGAADFHLFLQTTNPDTQTANLAASTLF